MRVLEHIKRVAPDRIEIETMVEDAVMLREPWRYRATYEHSAGSIASVTVIETVAAKNLV
jgi:hypothetical protein